MSILGCGYARCNYCGTTSKFFFALFAKMQLVAVVALPLGSTNRETLELFGLFVGRYIRYTLAERIVNWLYVYVDCLLLSI